MTDEEIFAQLDRMATSILSDCLDDMGIRDKVMSNRIRPVSLTPQMVGRAVTIEMVETSVVPESYSYKGELEAIDVLKPGDVFVVSTVRGGYWGEFMAKASHQKGCAGIVADAWTRDVRAIRQADLQVFAAGISPQDCPGRIEYKDAGVPITCGDVLVNPGDFIVGDDDGVVVVPREVIEEVLQRGEEKLKSEAIYQLVIDRGESLADLFLQDVH